MRIRTLIFSAVVLLLASVACQKTETTETESTTTVTAVSTDGTITTDTTMTTTTTVTTTPGTSTMDGTDQIKEGAKQLGEGLKEEARQAAAATGAALQRGGAELQQRAEEAAPKPATPAPAAAPAATFSGSAANGSSIFKAQCVACHGQDASGNTAMGKKNNIPDLRSPAVQGLPDAQLASVIANGKPGGLSATAHKSKALTASQTQDVIAYLRSIRQ